MRTVELDPEVATQLEAYQENGENRIESDIRRVVNDAVREYLNTLELQQLREEQKAFQRQHPQLVDQYLGKYVAFYQGQMIDVDDDQHTLYVRVHQQYPDTAIGIFPVTKTGEIPIYRSTSTRLPSRKHTTL